MSIAIKNICINYFEKIDGRHLCIGFDQFFLRISSPLYLITMFICSLNPAPPAVPNPQ